MRIVVDTNILVSGIFWGGTPFKILKLWSDKKVQLVGSEKILNEYNEIISRVSQKIKRPDLATLWSKFLTTNLELIVVKKSFKVCRDSDDDMFIDAAVAGKAKFIVSGDDDLLSIGKFLNTEILTARSFLNRMD